MKNLTEYITEAKKPVFVVYRLNNKTESGVVVECVCRTHEDAEKAMNDLLKYTQDIFIAEAPLI